MIVNMEILLSSKWLGVRGVWGLCHWRGVIDYVLRTSLLSRPVWPDLFNHLSRKMIKSFTFQSFCTFLPFILASSESVDGDTSDRELLLWWQLYSASDE